MEAITVLQGYITCQILLGIIQAELDWLKERKSKMKIDLLRI